MPEIIVCLKEAIDVAEIRTDWEQQRLILDGVPLKISDFDKNALETAIQIKEKLGGKITTLTVGKIEAQDRVREALAMGADESIILSDPLFEKLDAYATALILAAGIKKLDKKFDLILCGEASIDSFSALVGPLLASILDLPLITYARKVDAEPDKVKVERDLGEFTAEVECSYPVVITVVREINEPRLPTLMQILSAARKPITSWNAEELGIKQPTDYTSLLSTSPIMMTRKNIIFEGEVEDTVNKLVNELTKSGCLK